MAIKDSKSTKKYKEKMKAFLDIVPESAIESYFGKKIKSFGQFMELIEKKQVVLGPDPSHVP